MTPSEAEALKGAIRGWGRELGLDAVGFAPVELGEAEARFLAWLAAGRHGEMDYMARHGTARSRPRELVPGTCSVITARIEYLPPGHDAAAILADPARAYVSRYALGRDYHKLLRGRLQRLASRMEAEIGPFAYRAFTDSAPVLEAELASLSGLGWRGKHTLLIDRRAGSWSFLGELYTDLPLPADAAEPDHCGRCRACLDICPTGAIVAPYEVDARRCISYLTIELKGAIPVELRPLMGNRIYGCDDCQLACPWNRFARPTREADFRARPVLPQGGGLDAATLIGLFAWTQAQFEERLAGSAIRRIGHERWLRNIAVALGNGAASTDAVEALRGRLDHPSALVREHVEWALIRLGSLPGR